MRPIKQRYSNDCSIASVAMATRQSYERALAVAKENGFIPGGAYGYDVGDLLFEMGYDFHTRVYIPYKRDRARRPLPMRQPLICSIPSLNHIRTTHAIVVENGVVYDPSRKKRSSFNNFMLNRGLMYYGIVKERT